MGSPCRLFWLSVLSLCFLYRGALSAEPEKYITRFSNLPTELIYFENSEVVVYFDPMARVVWRSNNEGKDWKMVNAVPWGKAVMFISHQFNPLVAFILTDEKTHYRTTDRGETWRSFDVPAPPAIVAHPLSFHYENTNYILYQGAICEGGGWWGGQICHDSTFYTLDAFDSTPKLLLDPTRSCLFAHSSKDFKHAAHRDLVFCIAWDTASNPSSRSSKLFTSTDFFNNDRQIVSFPGGNRDSDGVIALSIVNKFVVAAVRYPSTSDEMLLFVSVDATTWAKMQFPRAPSSKLRENAYTIVESTVHSLGVDVFSHPKSAVGTLFVSNSNGTYFVQSLQNTNRNIAGFVDYERISGVEGVGLANIVDNGAEVDERGVERIVKSLATFDDGSNWAPLLAPSKDILGKDIGCDPSQTSTCSLHLHSVSSPQNLGRVFSSPAPGYVLGVGSVGASLLPYDQCDTFLSTDAGASWRMVHKGAHKYEFGDQGSVMVIVGDEDGVDHISYSYDSGKTWQDFALGVKIRARVLTTVPDSTSQRFLLIGTLHKSEKNADNQPHATIFLDLGTLRTRKCGSNDFEKWYPRNAKGKPCIMGHKQWYIRKRPEAKCYVGDKITHPAEHEENCPCGDEDYECDFNYIHEGDKCVPQGPEPIPTDNRGIKKDAPKLKDCSKRELAEGEIAYQTFEFKSQIVQQECFTQSQNILIRLLDGTIWQSSNEGYLWRNPFPNIRFLAFYMNRYASDRAYLITYTKQIYGTVDAGKTWKSIKVNHPANTLNIPSMAFHPHESDWIIWIGSTPGCSDYNSDCHTEAEYTTNNGISWSHIDSYVKGCVWGRDADLKIDSQLVICQSYRDKKGNQALLTQANPVELWSGTNFYRNKTKLFDNVVGFTKSSEYLLVAELQTSKQALGLQVSLDGRTFTTGQFPPSMHPDNHAYTVLEFSTDSIFLHLTMSDQPGAEFGNILKSNSDGTFYDVSIEHVNRNGPGYVDFEKMIGLDGIALVNVVANPEDVVFTRHKSLQTRITHNDGGSWKSLTPPPEDSHKQPYPCTSTRCALHIHGYTERFDPRATYSTPSVPGLLMAVGNVGEQLLPYTECDTFISRDAGFTWEEVHKGPHLWELGESIFVMVSDAEPTDRVLVSTNEGLSWREYQFGDKMRVRSIATVLSDTSQEFIVFGSYPSSPSSAVAVHIHIGGRDKSV